MRRTVMTESLIQQGGIMQSVPKRQTEGYIKTSYTSSGGRKVDPSMGERAPLYSWGYMYMQKAGSTPFRKSSKMSGMWILDLESILVQYTLKEIGRSMRRLSPMLNITDLLSWTQ